MKKNTMNYLKLLFIVLLAALLLGLETKNRLYLTYMIIFGIIGAALFLLWPKAKKMFMFLQKRMHKTKRSKSNTPSPAKPKTDITMALLCQFSHRITAKLKSAYPDATWDWETKPNVTRLLDGDVARIRTTNTGDYNFAEMYVDSYGNIVLRMMLIQSLDRDSKPSEPEKEAPMVVDCSSWFSLLGEKALVDIIGELNSHGHSSLYIDNAGNVLIKEDNEPMDYKTQIPHFPGEKYYEELISIFAQAELKAAVENGNIKLSW